MSCDTAAAPDLLQRFAPTPHVFIVRRSDGHAGREAGSETRIESNDRKIALALRRLCGQPTGGGGGTVALWKILRDRRAPRGGGESTILADGPLRTLLLGAGTILTFDRERREVFGFLACGVTPQELVNTLLPLLLATDVANQKFAQE